MKLTNPLKPGDTIGICAPARKVTPEEMRPGIALMESWGLKVHCAKNLYGSYHQFSGTDEERSADMYSLLEDPEVKAIICARGGYGCMRIVDRIDFSSIAARPKPLIGFSDVTVFLQHVQQWFGWDALHAPMVYSMAEDRTSPEAIGDLRRLLFGEDIRYEIPSSPLERKGEAEGILMGGNLSLLYALSGSASDTDMRGKILFMEDLDEYLYHVDRMMMQLKRSGKLASLKGLIVGGMSDMKDNAVPFGSTAEEIIIRAVEDYDYPVCMNFPAGHIRENHPLIFGKTVKLTVGDMVRLV